jgi:hypothetical protein
MPLVCGQAGQATYCNMKCLPLEMPKKAVVAINSFNLMVCFSQMPIVQRAQDISLDRLPVKSHPI